MFTPKKGGGGCLKIGLITPPKRVKSEAIEKILC